MKPEERQTLERLFSLAPKLELAYEFCQQLTDIFEQDLSKKVAKIKIQAWIKKVRASGFKCFDDFLKTLTHWWEEITNYFVSRANSGFVEGFNNKLKVLKRRCYEIYNLEHLFQRIYLDLEVEKKLGWVTGFRSQSQDWGELFEMMTATEGFIRHHGRYQEVHLELEKHLPALPARTERTQRLRGELIAFVTEQEAQVRQGERLPGSSEVIESIFG